MLPLIVSELLPAVTLPLECTSAVVEVEPSARSTSTLPENTRFASVRIAWFGLNGLNRYSARSTRAPRESESRSGVQPIA